MNNKNPIVTVRISAYNHENYIKMAVESVCNQSFQDFELIVIDDASTDNTPNILSKLAEIYSFKLILNQENKGLNQNNKLSLDVAKGKYIAGLGSDDYWPKDRLKIQVETMESNPSYGFSYGKVIRVNELSTEIGTGLPDGFSGWIFEKLFLSNHSGISATSVMFKTELLRQAQVHEKKMYINDKYMYLKVSKLAPVLYIDEFLSFYRVHDNHYSSNLLKMFEGKLQLLREFRNEKLYSKAVKNAHLSYLRKASVGKDKLAMLKLLIHSFPYSVSISYWKSIIRYIIK